MQPPPLRARRHLCTSIEETINSVFIYHTKSHPCLPSRIASNCVHSLHTPILSCRSSPPYAAVLVAPRVMLSLLRRRLPPRPAAIVLSGLLPFLPVRSSAPPLSLFLSLSLSPSLPSIVASSPSPRHLKPKPYKTSGYSTLHHAPLSPHGLGGWAGAAQQQQLQQSRKPC